MCITSTFFLGGGGKYVLVSMMCTGEYQSRISLPWHHSIDTSSFCKVLFTYGSCKIIELLLKLCTCTGIMILANIHSKDFSVSCQCIILAMFHLSVITICRINVLI